MHISPGIYPEDDDRRSTRFRCLLVGANALVVSCAELLLSRGHEVVGLVSEDAGIRDWARQRKLSTHGFGTDLTDRLSAEPFDYLFSIANLRILPAPVLDLPRRLPVNFHDGLLPRHAGLYATTWAVADREVSHGVTWHIMTERADEGDILVQRAVPVTDQDTSHTLNAKCFEAGYASFGELLDGLESGGVPRTPQDLSARSYHGRFDRPPGGGFLTWDRPSAVLHAAVRAADLGPHPNEFGTAKIVIGDTPALVGGLTPLPGPPAAPPGSVLRSGQDGLVVATVDGAVRLTRLTTPTGEPLTATALAARGVRPGHRLPGPDPGLLGAASVAQTGSLRDERYWVRRLAELTPADLIRAEGAERGSGGHVTVSVPVPPAATRAAAITGLRRDQWLLAAQLAFLARLGTDGETDVHWRAAHPATGHPAVDALYASFVPLRVPCVDGADMATFGALLAERTAEADRHRTHPHDLWVRHPRLRAHRPPAPGLPIAVEVCDDLAVPAAPADGTSLLIRIPRGSGGPGQWVAREDTCDGRTLALLADYATAFMAAVATGEGSGDLTRIPLGSPAHRRAATRWNDAAAGGPPPDGCVHQLVARQARLRPDAPAVSCGERVVSYTELDRGSSALAGHLRDRGIGAGSLVGVFLDRTAELPVTLLGIMKSGAAYVPLDPIYPPERIAYMLIDTSLSLIVTESRLAGRLPEGHGEVLVLDRDRPVIAAARPEPGDDVRGDQDVYVLYTSGSTGRPKGVRIGHRALTNLVRSMCRTPGVTGRDTLLAVTTVCFDIAGLELYCPLAAGGRVDVAPVEAVADGARLREVLERVRPTVMQATPATWRMLLDAGWPGTTDIPLPRILCGGEALTADLAGELLAHGAQLWNMYGPTETTIWSAVKRIRPRQPVTLGRPIAHTRFHVVDRWMRPVPPGVPGELLIGGAGVAQGYLHRPDLTAERFLPDIYSRSDGTVYRTGDLVRQRADGELDYLGRLDDQVKLHGYRIEPGEIEDALRRHPGVAEAVVVVREDRPGDRRLVAYTVPARPGARPAELRGHLRATLPDYMVPTAFVELGALPLTANGKTDRQALPRPARTTGGGTEPTGCLERAIATVWCQVLGADTVGIDDNFFEAGGTSLLLMRVMARINADVGASLTRVDMFMYPTVRSLARHLDGQRLGRTAPRPDPAAHRGTGRSRSGLGDLRRRRRQHHPADETSTG
ncbi:amino acid adenylation domain-containing protein [Streptomyces coffeae]|uniref:Amino acid adenylation domain-containing protein n=1 Tax=Streptomyces coffeae TaxID=621382 RepID=A0ABS1NBD2_9ACTN|nr:amino acid adenylation domain-containing protein [Streptomyces coffeae]MBL1097385.1 amino acid adenylation domain-containing protein [Streptomyces coffeae]